MPGLFGKLPSRADFVHVGLPRAMTQAWDAWMSLVLAGSQAAMGERWRSAWLEAPVWRFALPDGMCGPEAVLGLWLPSVDRAGRLFPLMLAACSPASPPEVLARTGAAWLDVAEAAGRAALTDDLDPATLASRLPAGFAIAASATEALPGGIAPTKGAGLWWTEGSPRVPAQGLSLDHMPDLATFIAMLDAEWIYAREAG